MHHGQDLTSSCISPVSGFIRTFRLYYRQGKIRNSVARKPLFKACILTLFFAVGSEQAAQQSLRSFQAARNITIFWDGKPLYLIDAFRRLRQTFCSQPQFFRLHWRRKQQDALKFYSVLPHYTASYVRSLASSFGYILIISNILVTMIETASPSSRMTLRC